MDSNILVGSNVLEFETESPLFDPEFVAEIQDYELLKKLEPYIGHDGRSVRFSGKQEQILRTELRCIYAKNDPCWGYSDEQKRIVSACINGDCPKIKECNKNYSKEEAVYWRVDKEQKALYGDPHKQPEYYFVDMISDAEMKQYDVEPQNDGLEYPTIKNPVIDDKKKKAPKTRIDPVTGRKQVVIGQRWQITDNSDYQGEEIVDIWGFVDDVAERKVKRQKKAKKLEKIEPVTSIIPKKAPVEPVKTKDPDYVNKELYESKVTDITMGVVKLTEIGERYDEDSTWMIVLANPAERAYVSSMLLMDELDHGFSTNDAIQLVLIGDVKELSAKSIFVSDTVLNAGCLEKDTQGWKKLSEASWIMRLDIPDRDYFNFEYGDGLNRWTCRNMYGVTHVCVDSADVTEIDAEDGLYSVSLVEDRDSYLISKKDGMPLGRLGQSFFDVITALKESKEIESSPAVIKGISIAVKSGKATVLGMGHLKFIEY